MGSDSVNKSERAEAAADAMTARATAMAQRLKDAAARGGPAIDRLSARVHGKLNGIPQERIQSPPATIEAPTALHYVLLGENEDVTDLREMFENLLASSMDRDTAANTHPAFASMISQLTPDEARILKSIDRADYAFVNVYVFDQNGGRQIVASGTTLGIGSGIDEERQLQYISNLDRLGILRFSTRSSADIEGHNALVDTIAAEFAGRHAMTSNETIEVTPFGRQFLDACIRRRPR
jgi:abortive infection alpha-like protein